MASLRCFLVVDARCSDSRTHALLLSHGHPSPPPPLWGRGCLARNCYSYAWQRAGMEVEILKQTQNLSNTKFLPASLVLCI